MMRAVTFARIHTGDIVALMPDGSVCNAAERHYWLECLNYDANEFIGFEPEE